jgi:hypothetical protein
MDYADPLGLLLPRSPTGREEGGMIGRMPLAAVTLEKLRSVGLIAAVDPRDPGYAWYLYHTAGEGTTTAGPAREPDQVHVEVSQHNGPQKRRVYDLVLAAKGRAERLP